MAALAVRQSTGNGLVDALVAASGGGDTLANDGREILQVLNGGGAPITVTITTPAVVGGYAVADVSQAVAAGARWTFGPFDPGLFNDANGNVGIGYSAVTSVTVQALRV